MTAVTSESAPRLAPALDAALLPRPRDARSSSSSASSPAPGSSWRTCRSCRTPATTSPVRAGSQPVLVLRDEDGNAARLPQRLPPPRLAPPERLGPVRQGDPLPLPRLDLPHRRRADRRARGALDRRPRQVELGPVPGARRDALRPRLREPRHPREAAGRAGGRPARAARALRHRAARRRAASGTTRSPPTGRSSSTTTTRATTCRSPIPG